MAISFPRESVLAIRFHILCNGVLAIPFARAAESLMDSVRTSSEDRQESAINLNVDKILPLRGSPSGHRQVQNPT